MFKRLATTGARAATGGSQQPATATPAYLRYVNRRIGARLAAAGHRWGATPNHLTAVGATASGGAVVAVATVAPSPALAAAVAVGLLAGYAFDSADGQLARLHGDTRRAGEWLDHVVDVAKISSLHAAVAISWLRFHTVDTAWLLVPLAFGVVHVTFFFAVMLRDQLGGGPAPSVGEDDRARGDSIGRSIALLPIDHGSLCLAFAALARPTLFLRIYSALLAATTAFSTRSLVRSHRTLAAIDRRSGAPDSSGTAGPATTRSGPVATCNELS